QPHSIDCNSRLDGVLQQPQTTSGLCTPPRASLPVLPTVAKLKIFLAALISRSWAVWQSGQVHSLIESGIVSCTLPHSEQVLLVGAHRSTCTNSRPYH